MVECTNNKKNIEKKKKGTNNKKNIEKKKKGVNKKNPDKVKRICFKVTYEYPASLDNEDILDMFAEQIFNNVSNISSDNIEIVDKKKEIKEDTEIVCIDVSDLLEVAIKEILDTRGGIYYHDIEYIGTENIDGRDRLQFTIPKRDRTGKCNEILDPEHEDSGCGETGGACICGKPEGHEGDHECELCGQEW